MKGSIGSSTRLTSIKRTPKRLHEWRTKKNKVIGYLQQGNSVKNASRKFHLKEETIYKMINFG